MSLERATSYKNRLLTSQIAMPADACRTIYAASKPYGASAANFTSVSVERDDVFADSASPRQIAAQTPMVTGGASRSAYKGVPDDWDQCVALLRSRRDKSPPVCDACRRRISAATVSSTQRDICCRTFARRYRKIVAASVRDCCIGAYIVGSRKDSPLTVRLKRARNRATAIAKPLAAKVIMGPAGRPRCR